MTSTTAFISELVQAANEIDRLTKDERAGLMRRAATTIRDMREQTAMDVSAANDNADPLDVVGELYEMARLIDLFTPAEIAERLLNAAEVIEMGNDLVEGQRANLCRHPGQA